LVRLAGKSAAAAEGHRRPAARPRDAAGVAARRSAAGRPADHPADPGAGTRHCAGGTHRPRRRRRSPNLAPPADLSGHFFPRGRRCAATSFRAVADRVSCTPAPIPPRPPPAAMTTRRSFLKASAAAVAVPAVAPAVGKPDTLTVALIGCGGMGKNHLKLLAANKQLKIAHVCDVDAKRLEEAAQIATDGGHNGTPGKGLPPLLANRAGQPVVDAP